MGNYILNSIDLENFGIIPGTAPNSDIALEGCFDFPKRTGDISYAWDDEDGDEPFVDEDDIYYEGRTIKFYGFIAEGQNSYVLLQELYDLVNAFPDLVLFETPYGDFEVLVKKITPTHSEDATKVLIELREPEVDLSGEIPATEDSNYMIDDIPLKSFGLYVSKKDQFSGLAGNKKMQFTAYNFEGYQITRREANTIQINAFILASDLTDFKSKISSLYALFATAGIRDLTVPIGTESIVIECYSRDGFSVSNVQISSRVTATISIRLEACYRHLLSDLSLLFDLNGDPLYDSYNSRLTSLN